MNSELSKLCGNKKFIKILYELSNKGIIAGSSIASILLINNDFKNQVQDIDIFVNNEKDFNDCLLILKDLKNTYKTYLFNEDYYSIISVFNPESKLPFQIVMTKQKTALELITSFDMDYIQCSFHKGKIITTSAFDEVLKTGQSTKFNKDLPFSHRISKTLDKGFSVPLFGIYNKKNIDMDIITEKQAFEKRKCYFNIYYDEDKFSEMIEYKKLKIIDWKPTRKKNYFEIGKFILKAENKNYYVSEICITIIIKEYFEDTKHILIEKNNIIEKLNIKNLKLQCPFLGLGKYQAIIQICLANFNRYGRIMQLLNNERILDLDIDIEKSEPIKFIDQHRNKTDKLSFYKHNAYQAYNYYRYQENKTEKESVILACRQMAIDYNKLHRDNLLLLTLTFHSHKLNNEKEMIDFIEGFHLKC